MSISLSILIDFLTTEDFSPMEGMIKLGCNW